MGLRRSGSRADCPLGAADNLAAEACSSGYDVEEHCADHCLATVAGCSFPAAAVAAAVARDSAPLADFASGEVHQLESAWESAPWHPKLLYPSGTFLDRDQFFGPDLFRIDSYSYFHIPTDYFARSTFPYSR